MADITVRPTIQTVDLVAVGTAVSVERPANAVEWSIRVRSGVVKFKTALDAAPAGALTGGYLELGPLEGVSSPGQKNNDVNFRVPTDFPPAIKDTESGIPLPPPFDRIPLGLALYEDVAPFFVFDLDASSPGNAVVEIMWA